VGRQLAAIFIIATSAGVAAFVIAALIGGQYPFGPDDRPWCSGAGVYGLSSSCHAGPLPADWFHPFLWPGILTSCVGVAIGVLRVARRRD
jgi:hypothetical protein